MVEAEAVDEGDEEMGEAEGRDYLRLWGMSWGLICLGNVSAAEACAELEAVHCTMRRIALADPGALPLPCSVPPGR